MNIQGFRRQKLGGMNYDELIESFIDHHIRTSVKYILPRQYLRHQHAKFGSQASSAPADLRSGMLPSLLKPHGLGALLGTNRALTVCAVVFPTELVAILGCKVASLQVSRFWCPSRPLQAKVASESQQAQGSNATQHWN